MTSWTICRTSRSRRAFPKSERVPDHCLHSPHSSQHWSPTQPVPSTSPIHSKNRLISMKQMVLFWICRAFEELRTRGSTRLTRSDTTFTVWTLDHSSGFITRRQIDCRVERHLQSWPNQFLRRRDASREYSAGLIVLKIGDLCGHSISNDA